MLLLTRAGRRGQALAQYEACRRALADALDIEPAQETVALAEQIRSGALGPEQRARAVDAPPHDAYSLAAPRRHGDAPQPGRIFGRREELQTFEHWLSGERDQVVAILGIGGVGKSALAAQLVAAVSNQYDHVIWRSLLNAPPLEDLLYQCIQSLSAQASASLPASQVSRLDTLLSILRKRRCLLVLDNLETIMQAGVRAGTYRPGYHGYGELIERLARERHASCLLLTSREQPLELTRLDGELAPVRSLRLSGLDPDSGGQVLRERGLVDRGGAFARVVACYSGNPLALNLVATIISDFFSGDAAAFLRGDTPIFEDIRDVLDQQFARLSALERELLIWLAIEREPVTLEILHADLASPEPLGSVLDAARSLQRRFLLESVGGRITLQNVVLEYVTDRLVRAPVDAVLAGERAR
jgi:hypothetical protein